MNLFNFLRRSGSAPLARERLQITGARALGPRRAPSAQKVQVKLERGSASRNARG